MDAIFNDNPLITKHIRSRLRRNDLLAPIVIVLIVSIFTAWICSQDGGGNEGAGIFALITIQCLILFLAGTAQVANAVAQTRDSGTLDFHRISPLSPLALTVGFLLGAPIREWLMAGVLIPIELLLMPTSKIRPEAFMVLLGSMVVCALMYHLFGLVVGLITPKTRVASSVVGFVLFLNFFCAAGPVGYFTMAPAWILALKWSNAFHLGNGNIFGLLPERHFLMAMLHQLTLIVFLLIGAVREIRQERAYFSSKLGTVAFFAIFSALGAVDLNNFDTANGSVNAWIFLYSATGLAMAMLATVTPDARDFAKGVRRAIRANLARPLMWTDTAPNWLPMFGMMALLAVGATTMMQYDTAHDSMMAGFPRSVLVGMASLCAFASARQGFELRFGKRNKSYFALLIFMLWIVPLLLAAFIGKGGDNDVATFILGLCPWLGMGLVAGKTSTATILLGFHLALAAYATYWRWNIEQVSTAAARQVR